MYESHERELIGCCILDSTCIDIVGRNLSGADFVDDRLGRFFDHLKLLNEAGQPINDVSLLVLESSRFFGDQAHSMIAELAIAVPHASHFGHYAKTIIECSQRRKLLNLSDAIKRKTDHGSCPERIVSFADAALSSIGSSGDQRTITAMEAATELIAEIESPSKRRPVLCGIDLIDNVMGGLMPGELQVIAARPGCGKTSFAMQVARRTAVQGRGVLFVSLEMSSTELVARMLASMAEIDGRQLRSGSADVDKLRSTATYELDGMPLSIFDPPAATMQTIRAVAKIHAARHGLELVVIDYIGLVRPRDNRIPRTEQVAEITGTMKQVAKELELPVIALCQLNRQADGQVPILSHLRESGAIEQDADVVSFLHRENKRDYKFIIAKHRHGQTGDLSISFDAKRTTFEVAS